MFDAHGVVFNGGYKHTARVVAERFEKNVDDVYAIMYTQYVNQAVMREITQEEAWDMTVADLHLPITGETLRDIHYELLSSNTPMLEFAEQLRGKGYVIMILSKNTSVQMADNLRDNPKVVEVFGQENIINTWELHLPKASKETMEWVTDHFNVTYDEMLYIDDQEANLEIPKELGVTTIFFRNNEQVFSEVNKVL